MSFFLGLKIIHVFCALMSYCLFVLRSYWRFQSPVRLQQVWVRRLPHIIDTILLLSALLMALMIGQYPVVNDWLTTKTIALFCYIGMGLLTLRFARNRWQILIASLVAQLIFFYIVCVAIYHSM